MAPKSMNKVLCPVDIQRKGSDTKIPMHIPTRQKRASNIEAACFPQKGFSGLLYVPRAKFSVPLSAKQSLKHRVMDQHHLALLRLLDSYNDLKIHLK